MATAATSLAYTVSFAFRLISIYGQLYCAFGIVTPSDNKNPLRLSISGEIYGI